MLVTFVDKLAVLFDRRFIVAYWSPVFLTSGLALGSLLIVLGTENVLEWWSSQSEMEKALLGIAVLLSITILGYILQALTIPIVQWYEGYWPRRLHGLANLARQAHVQQKETLRREADNGDQVSRHRFYHDYPGDPSNLRPTLLGNVLTAAEEYPFRVYGLDAVAWWRRLTPLLPEQFRSELNDSVTPLLALLNLSALIALLTICLLINFTRSDISWGLMIWGAVLGAVLSYLCYQAALSQARMYGDMIRVAFDLYRLEILKQMQLPVPDNLLQERALWTVLNERVIRGVPPWQVRRDDGTALWPVREPDLQDREFYYANRESPAKPLEVRIIFDDPHP